MLGEKVSELQIGTKQNPLTLIGRSRAGEATSFWLKELNWLLDCGCLIGCRKPRVILVTHTHQDHVSSLTHLGDKDRPPQVYMPVVAAPLVKRYLQAHQSMQVGRQIGDDEKLQEYRLLPVQPNKSIQIHQGRSFLVKTIPCVHRIDCIGYSIFEEKHRLKNDYKSLTGREIGALHRQGVVVKESYLDPILCFLGDTTHMVFSSHPEILSDHHTVIVECTFLFDQDTHRAEETTHIHWDMLRPLVMQHPSTLFVLIHFSLKYKTLDILRVFQDYSNVHPVLHQDDIDSEFHKISANTRETAVPRCCCFKCQPRNPTSANV